MATWELAFATRTTEQIIRYKKSHLITGKVGVDINCFCVLLLGFSMKDIVGRVFKENSVALYQVVWLSCVHY